MIARHLLTAAVALAWAGAAAAQPAPLLTLKLKPGPADQPDGVGYVDVTVTAPAVQAAAGQPLLTLPIVIANTASVADTLTGLQVRDAGGAVPLTIKDDPESNSYSRHWLAGRPVAGDLTVTYRAPVDNTPPKRGSGPPYQLRTEGGGVSGVGNTFVILPETKTSHRVAIRWDLSNLAKGSTATSSHGDGDVEIAAGPVERLSRTVFMAGPLHRQPEASDGHGFSSAWLGEPPFDPKPLMAWTQTLHGWMTKFFQDPSEPPYRVFIRFNPVNAGGGVAFPNSFMTTYGKTTEGESIKGTLAHEMTHTWTATGEGQWYSEGNAVHYQRLLPLRAGLITPAEFLEDLNETASRYYSNLLNDTPDDQIAPRFWEDTRIRVLPYDRGAMYFAVLDGKIRKASGGERSVDDLILEMVKRSRRGESVDEAAWLTLLDGALGAEGLSIHKSMMAGGLMLPDSDAYGPCFERTTGKVRRFDLGFDPKSLVGNVKTIRGLKPDSEAARAGLKGGDVVTYAVAMDGLQGQPTTKLTLQVTRDGKTFPLTYLPRGEETEIYQWKRVAGVPDDRCAY